MLIVIIIFIVAMSIILALSRYTTPKSVIKDYATVVFEDCKDHIDQITYDHTYLNVHYFKYNNYEIVLWIPGYITIRDLLTGQGVELSDNDELAYELGTLLKQKIK